MIGIVELRTIESLENYRITWDDLWRKTLPQSFTSSFAWYSAYVRHYRDEVEPRALVVSVAGKTVGILPLVQKRVSSRVGSLRMLTLPRCRWGSIERPIGPNTTATLMLALRHIQKSRDDWNLLDLRDIHHDARYQPRLENTLRNAGMSFHRQTWSETPIVTMDKSWREYWGSRPTSLKNSARQIRNRYSHRGKIELLRERDIAHKSPHRLSLHLGDGSATSGAIAVDRSRADLWSDFEEIADLPNRDLNFLRDVHMSASAHGMSDMAVLRIGGEPVAASHGWINAGSVSNLWIERKHDESDDVESLFIESLLFDSYSRGDRQLSFRDHCHASIGEFATEFEPSYRYTHFSESSPKAQLLRLRQYMRNWWLAPRNEPIQPPHASPHVEAPRLMVVGE